MDASVFKLNPEITFFRNDAKAYQISANKKYRDILVLDGSYARFIELPSREKNIDNYSVCVFGFNKYFKSLTGVKTHKELVEAFMKKYSGEDSMPRFIKDIEGMSGFTVNDYRLRDNSSKLEKFIHKKAAKRYTASLEYFMYWYQSVSKILLDTGLSEAEVIHILKEYPIQVELIKAHGNGLTPEHLVESMLAHSDIR